MASNRDKLRAASRKNAQEHKTTSNQPTLVSDMVNQLNENNAEFMNAPVEEKPSQEKVEPVVEAPVEVPVEVKEPEAVSQAEENTSQEVKEPETVDAAKEEPEATSQGDAPAITPEEKSSQDDAFESIAGVPMISIEKYAEDNCLISLQVAPEINAFLAKTASKLRIPIKTYFKIIMANEIASGEIADDDLVDSYRVPQHGAVRRGISTNINLREDIKELAAANSMKYTPFMTYVIHKAMLNAQKIAQQKEAEVRAIHTENGENQSES